MKIVANQSGETTGALWALATAWTRCQVSTSLALQRASSPTNQKLLVVAERPRWRKPDPTWWQDQSRRILRPGIAQPKIWGLGHHGGEGISKPSA